MDTGSCKRYDTDDVDTKYIYDMYFCTTADEDLLREAVDFPIKVLYKWCKLGLIKGNILIDFSLGTTLFQFPPIYKCFKDIIILEINDCCVKDMEKWVNKEINSFDWEHAASIVDELDGTSNNWKEMEDDLRGRVKSVLKCDLSKRNPTDPVILEKADCLINLYVLGGVCKDIDDYSCKLKNMSTLLKKGGCLLLIGGFNASYFTVSDQIYHVLNFTEEDLRNILKNNGYRPERIELIERKSCVTLSNYGHIFVACAVKETIDIICQYKI